MIYYNLVAGIERAPFFIAICASPSALGMVQSNPSLTPGPGGTVGSRDVERVQRQLLELLSRVAMAASWVWTGGRAQLALCFTPSLGALGLWTGRNEGKRHLSYLRAAVWTYSYIWAHIRAAEKCYCALVIFLSHRGTCSVPWLAGSKPFLSSWPIRPSFKLVSYYLKKPLLLCSGILLAVLLTWE